MVDSDADLTRRFHDAMLAIYDASRRLNPPYQPAQFRRMVAEQGGREAANRLLAAKNPSSGFTELLLRGKENLGLSVEYLVLQQPWRQLFTEPQLAIARRRLEEAGYELPPPPDGTPEIDVPDAVLPEEVMDSGRLPEGSVRQVLVNFYERSGKARARCIAHYGTVCVVCGFDFKATYGPIATGHIHVHHLRPISEVGTEYEIDPVADLRPVCANCHSVIHLGKANRSIAEMRELIRNRDS